MLTTTIERSLSLSAIRDAIDNPQREDKWVYCLARSSVEEYKKFSAVMVEAIIDLNKHAASSMRDYQTEKREGYRDVFKLNQKLMQETLKNIDILAKGKISIEEARELQERSEIMVKIVSNATEQVFASIKEVQFIENEDMDSTWKKKTEALTQYITLRKQALEEIEKISTIQETKKDRAIARWKEQVDVALKVQKQMHEQWEKREELSSAREKQANDHQLANRKADSEEKKQQGLHERLLKGQEDSFKITMDKQKNDHDTEKQKLLSNEKMEFMKVSADVRKAEITAKKEVALGIAQNVADGFGPTNNKLGNKK